ECVSVAGHARGGSCGAIADKSELDVIGMIRENSGTAPRTVTTEQRSTNSKYYYFTTTQHWPSPTHWLPASVHTPFVHTPRGQVGRSASQVAPRSLNEFWHSP